MNQSLMTAEQEQETNKDNEKGSNAQQVIIMQIASKVRSATL